MTPEDLTDADIYKLRHELRASEDHIALAFTALALERDVAHPLVLLAKQYCCDAINARDAPGEKSP